MKKILSIILVFVLLLSVMPIAFAAEKTIKDIFIEECLKYHILINNNQMNSDMPAVGFCLDDQDFFEPIRTNDEETMLQWIDFFKSESSRIEAKIASGELIVVIDTSIFIEYYIKTMMVACIDISTRDRLSEITDMHPEILDDCDYAVHNMRYSKTQAEFDIYAKIWIDGCGLVLKHVYGEHDFFEYISNNDATEDADGTKTATCEFCGATDTVVDEGTKLKKEPASSFEMFIALLKEFFTMLLSIFS